MKLRFTVQTKIQKPAAEVFDALCNPARLSGYFTTGGSNGPLDEGATVLWRAAREGVYDPVTGSVPHPGGYDTTVEMTFEPLGRNETFVKIVEGEWRSTEDGLQGSYGNCQGWMNMSCCLKAFLEHGINLRQGAF